MNVPRQESQGGGPNGTIRMQVGVAAGADHATSDAATSENSLFAHYAISRRIGDGGMGVVFLARDRKLNRYVAIKRLNHHALSISTLRQRFLQEAQAVAALNHIYIVHVYALGEDSDGPYMVMEYVAGPSDSQTRANHEVGTPAAPAPPLTLESHVTRNGQLTTTEAVDVLIKIGRAVAYAHENGVIHRDLKPGNVLLDTTGEPKIVDFGLARLIHAEESKLTVPGEKLLSLGYGSPEQEQDASLTDERSDVYGLGAILYFALTGQNPRYFREQDIPVALRDVLVKALATDREQRWPSALAFVEALHAVQSKTKVETPTVKTTWRCKWCDTVNPLTIRYCAECGWDGGESCSECGADTFVGVQYCGNCGADARAYESVQHLLERMRLAQQRRQYERVMAFAGRVHGFEAAGPAGRQLLKEIQSLRDRADETLQRCGHLKELAPQEMKAENYERAQACVEEYRQLTGDDHAMSDMLQQLPSLQARRDLGRAQRYYRAGQYAAAEQICRALPTTNDETCRACRALLRDIAARRWASRIIRVVGGIAALVVLYILALAPLTHSGSYKRHGALYRFWQPAARLYRAEISGVPLRAYAARWGAQTAEIATTTDSAVPTTADLPELTDLQQWLTQSLAELEQERRKFAAAWPEEYLAELKRLVERRQVAGDYAGVVASQAELQQFMSARKIGNSPSGEFDELATLKLKYRQTLSEEQVNRARRRVALSRKYTNDLDTLLRGHTREGQLETAAVINEAIQREKLSPEVLEAEAILANLPGGSTESLPKVVGVPAPGAAGLERLQELRQQLDSDLAAIEADNDKRRAQWPKQYIDALQQQIERFQKAGEYEQWDRASSERDRFQMENHLSLEDMVDEPEALRNIQITHIDLLRQLSQARAQAIKTSFTTAFDKLEEWKRKLTQAGDMELAAAANAEVQQLKARRTYQAALRELAATSVAPTE